MTTRRTCGRCGIELDDSTAHGYCPSCLLRDGLEDAKAEGRRQKAESVAPSVDTERSTLNTQHSTHLGEYKLLEKIGEGGFGVVYQAEQLKPFHRRVALKIIKLGMDTRQVVARFEAERQALALMDHPNIASVFDGGSTASGRPYFVMELVQGIPITQHCDANRLLTRERLELFIQVCQAVQHAHQKGVIHRDLKPTNILVTVLDGKPVPKVIDFGVAKATEARLTEKTLFTQLHHWIGTPAYMSPEQAGLGSLDVDTRSDVYSLGVLLYELLTGHTPFDLKKLLEAGYEAMMRTIREEDPPKPSTRVSTLKLGDLSELAARHQTEPAKMRRSLRGDLDWIVMKAMEKDRKRRYQTAEALAQDLAHHLKSEPVMAGAPGKLYRFRKFARRNKVALSMSTVIVMLIAVGAGTTLWKESQRAQEEQAKHAAVGLLKPDIERRVSEALHSADKLNAEAVKNEDRLILLQIEDRMRLLRIFKELRAIVPLEAFNALTPYLESPDPKIRSRAFLSLQEFSEFVPQMADVLVQHLQHDSVPSVRHLCALLLNRVETDAVNRAYMLALNDSDERVVKLACLAIGGRTFPEGREALLGVLTNRSWEVRLSACSALIDRQAADQRVASTLEALLQHPEAADDLQNVEGVMQKLREAEATPALFRVLTNRSWHVRLSACKELIKLKAVDQRVISTMEALVLDPEATDYSQRKGKYYGVGFGEDTDEIKLETILAKARAQAEKNKP